jgi:two-component sensor histidine kinase
LPPTRKGFGSVILLEAARQFGRVVQKYSPEGMRYELSVKLDGFGASRTPGTLPRTLAS